MGDVGSAIGSIFSPIGSVVSGVSSLLGGGGGSGGGGGTTRQAANIQVPTTANLATPGGGINLANIPGTSNLANVQGGNTTLGSAALEPSALGQLAQLVNLAGIPATAAVPGAGTGASTSGAAALADIVASAAANPGANRSIFDGSADYQAQAPPDPTSGGDGTMTTSSNIGWNYPTYNQPTTQQAQPSAAVQQLIDNLPGLLGF